METAIPKLKPLSTGKLLDQAFRLFRNNFLKFIGIVAITQIPVTVLSLATVALPLLLSSFFSAGSAAPELLTTFLGLIMTVVVSVIATGVSTAAVTRAVAEDYLGEPISFLEAYRKIGDDWPRLIGALFLSGLIGIALGLWTLVPCIGWISGAGMSFFYTAIVSPLIAPIVVLEKQSAGDAVHRAWDLAHRRFWDLVKFAVALIVLSTVIVSGPAMLIQLLLQQALMASPSPTSEATMLLPQVLQSLVQLVLNLIYRPFSLTAITLLYFDLRVRTEGFDLSWLTGHALEGEDVDPDAIVQNAPPPQRNVFSLSREEFGNYIPLTIAFLILYFVFGLIIGGLGLASTGFMGGGL